MRTHVTWILAFTLSAAPALSFGAQQAADDQDVQLRNVELTPAGSLEGKVLTATGKPIANAEVIVRSQKDVNKAAQRVLTDENGKFLATGLSTGTCVVDMGEETYAVRVWNKGTAPPKSLRNVALIKPGEETVRGNRFKDNRFANWIRCMSPAQKLCLGVLVAAAIVIPIALDDDGS